MTDAEYVIVQDTREQNGLFKEGQCVIATLHTGDYSIQGCEETFSIERKSLADLFSTLSGGHDRFKKEIARSLELEYFAIVVEGSWTSMVGKTFHGAKYSKMPGSVIAKIITTIHIKYKVPVFFAQSRAEARSIIKHLCAGYLRNKS